MTELEICQRLREIKEAGEKAVLTLDDGQVLYCYPEYACDPADGRVGIDFDFEAAPESADVPWIRGLPGFSVPLNMVVKVETAPAD
jgi:hypothetical protein